MIPNLNKIKSKSIEQRTLFTIVIAIVFLVSVISGGFLLDEERIATNLN